MPRRTLPSVVAVCALAVVIGEGVTPVSSDLDRITRTLVAALAIGVVGRMLAHRARAPGCS